MNNVPFIRYDVVHQSYVAAVKRAIHKAAVEAFSVDRVGVIDLVASELTSNIVKHAGGGELLYRFSTENGSRTFEMISLDHGPGMKDISHSMKDGVTTTNTLGQG